MLLLLLMMLFFSSSRREHVVVIIDVVVSLVNKLFNEGEIGGSNPTMTMATTPIAAPPPLQQKANPEG